MYINIGRARQADEMNGRRNKDTAELSGETYKSGNKKKNEKNDIMLLWVGLNSSQHDIVCLWQSCLNQKIKKGIICIARKRKHKNGYAPEDEMKEGAEKRKTT